MLDSGGDDSRVLVGNCTTAKEEVRMVATDAVVILPDKIVARVSDCS